jgi:catalase
MRSAWLLFYLSALADAACPYMDADAPLEKRSDPSARDTQSFQTSTQFLNQFTLDDTDSFITSDAGGPIQDDTSLKAGVRGPTLLEDFIFRQKIQHFDHERVAPPLTFIPGLYTKLFG